MLLDPAFVLEDVDLSFPRNARPQDSDSGNQLSVLQKVSCQVAIGESVAITGASGSGKSSLLMLMGGLERPTAGKITVLGHTINAMGESALARFRRNHIGVVFQSFHLIPTLTALDNVALPLHLVQAKNAESRARKELAQIGLAARTDHYPAELSGGEQQRVALARAAVVCPHIILADEPTGNLDSHNGKIIIDLLLSMQKTHNSTLILVTHSEVLSQQCNRIIALHDGQIVTDRTNTNTNHS